MAIITSEDKEKILDKKISKVKIHLESVDEFEIGVEDLIHAEALPFIETEEDVIEYLSDPKKNGLNYPNILRTLSEFDIYPGSTDNNINWVVEITNVS